MSNQDDSRTVTVFGAGVTGLTAAHELAVRGFKVTVIDRDINEQVQPHTLDWGIGGIARSQYFCRHPLLDPALDAAPSAVDETGAPLPIPRLRAVSEFMFDDTFVFAKGAPYPASDADAAAFLTKLRRLLEQHPRLLKDPYGPKITLYFRAGDAPLVAARREYLRDRLGLAPELFAKIAQTIEPADQGRNKGRDRDWVTVATGIDIFPGEHGFRFFPGFYRHLFDTMKRTPILDPLPSERALSTVFDNLVSADGLGFARAGKVRAFVLPRHPATSFETFRRYLRLFSMELGYTLTDLARFELALFKYMTSCSARRARDYEDLSWSDFVDLPRYSQVLREHLEYGPQMMVALRGSASDARTQGNIVTQLLKDQLIANQRPDATLNAPTSAAWFNHWKTYLENQGVELRRGTLVDFQGEPAAAKPDRSGQTEARIIPIVVAGDSTQKIKSGHVVLALSLQQIAELRPRLQRAVAEAGIALPPDNDLERIRVFAGDLSATLGNARPDGPLQHLTGIQFYFDTEVKFWRGHTQYLDSRWGLTSISQPQFWARARDTRDHFRSLLSVDIGIWDRSHTPEPAEGPRPTDDAWSQVPDEIAAKSWKQIHDHHDDAFAQQYGKAAQFPRPIAYALDQHIRCEGAQKQNLAPYLVNEAGRYRLRPGALSDGDTRPKGQSSYAVIGKLVLAGTYMQTFTRMTSMEAANESARHAVNAILDQTEMACDRCEIWDPEEHELEDLVWFKDLDRELFERGLPHFVETMGWSELPGRLPAEFFRRAKQGEGT